MTVYHQMGHHSTGLLSEQDLHAYVGALLSPVNCTEDQITRLVHDQGRDGFEMIFDPQLYYPNTQRGVLPEWSYFPSDVETADQSSFSWWSQLFGGITDVVRRFRPHAVCSPAVVPRIFSNDYYLLNRQVAEEFQNSVGDCDIEVLQTLLVKLEHLASPGMSETIASIAGGGRIDRVYLVFSSDIEPRYELREVESLKGAMRLIHYLEGAGIRVLVGCASSDVVLWKAAGATSCATGKFFNLRRFTPSRWAPPPEGGGQVSYWFEESMMAFLRESDVTRIRAAGFLSPASLSNPYGGRILAILDAGAGGSWLGLGWRQYLYWFADFERRLESGAIRPDDVLKGAEGIWGELEVRSILMEERPNDSGWLRPWRRALAESLRDIGRDRSTSVGY